MTILIIGSNKVYDTPCGVMLDSFSYDGQDDRILKSYTNSNWPVTSVWKDGVLVDRYIKD